jgi:hypothetical protein
MWNFPPPASASSLAVAARPLDLPTCSALPAFASFEFATDSKRIPADARNSLNVLLPASPYILSAAGRTSDGRVVRGRHGGVRPFGPTVLVGTAVLGALHRAARHHKSKTRRRAPKDLWWHSVNRHPRVPERLHQLADGDVIANAPVAIPRLNYRNSSAAANNWR